MTPGDLVIEENLAYGDELALDVYRPADATGPLPALLYFHGGGWARGSRRDRAPQRLEPLARRGLVIVAVSYRFGPAHRWPAQLQDARAALAFVAAHTGPLGVDPARISVWGASAGGQIAAMLALDGAGIHRAVIWFGAADLASLATDPRPADAIWPEWIPRRGPDAPPPVAALVDLDAADGGARALRAASPVHHVAAGAPPFLILHGERDAMIAASQSQRLHEALTDVGARSRLVIVPGATHEDPAFESPELLDVVAGFAGAS